MSKRKSYMKIIEPSTFLLIGISIGIILIWPGIVTFEGRRCFLKIIKDSSDGSISLNTLFSIKTSYIFKIKNQKNKYVKGLLVGDYCFRKFQD